MWLLAILKDKILFLELIYLFSFFIIALMVMVSHQKSHINVHLYWQKASLCFNRKACEPFP